MTLLKCTIGLLATLVCVSGHQLTADELRIPAFTAYMLPNADSARISERKGVTHWEDPTQSVNWYGKFEGSTELVAKVSLYLSTDTESKLRMTVGDISREVSVTGKGSDTPVMGDFGTFSIRSAGHHRFSLESLNSKGNEIGRIESLVLEGDGIKKSHFNLKERRNAASVHLMYPVPANTEVEAFYCEVTADKDPVATFYMACGWHRGYFGMQVNSPTERRIIFSVWDSGEEGVDRRKVADENRVKLMSKGEGVYSGDFGNEGTGGHSHLKILWKTGEKQRFIVTAEPTDKVTTVFSGYWFHPEKNEWMLISSWKAPKEGGRLKGLHSFSENFGGENGHLLRKARYGNQWIRTPEGQWLELVTAKFSHDPTGREDRFDRYMGVENGEFFLSHGGFRDGFSKYGDAFHRDPTAKSPADLKLPSN